MSDVFKKGDVVDTIVADFTEDAIKRVSDRLKKSVIVSKGDYVLVGQSVGVLASAPNNPRQVYSVRGNHEVRKNMTLILEMPEGLPGITVEKVNICTFVLDA